MSNTKKLKYRFERESLWDIPGTLAACCKPSSGAGVVWMVIPLRGWVRLPAMKNGDRLKVPLPNSLFTRVQTSRKTEERKPEESLCKCSHKSNVAKLGVQGLGFYPQGHRSFSAILCFEACNNDDNSCAYSALAVSKSL